MQLNGKSWRTYKVVVGVLDRRERQHANEWHCGGDGRQRRDGGDDLKHEQAQEVEVGQTLELLKQVERQERDDRVFRRLDIVILEREQRVNQASKC